MRPDAVTRIDAALEAGVAYVPAVIALEIAQKCSRGRLELELGSTPREWYELTMQRSPWQEIPLAASVALAAYELPEPFHRDPADRLIVAMARLLDAPVVTVDRQILAYGRLGHVQIIDY
jgi:PIN domain nuclease of toxin-antitoxin system